MTSLVFDPLIPWMLIAALGVLAVLAVGLALWRGLAGWLWRALAFGAVIAALANPSLQSETREGLTDIALILRDDTGSNRLAGRPAQVQEARDHLAGELTRLGVQVQDITVGDAPDNAGSLLAQGLTDALADLPRDRLAGVFMLSDGLAHDGADAADLGDTLGAPVHLLRTGEPGDWDRRVIVSNAPAYGILGEELTLTLRVEDQGAVPPDLAARPARIGYSLNGEDTRFAQVPLGQDLDLTLTLERGGANVLHFVLDPAPGELTERNNQAVVQINGIRDRLRVLLVSGEPHTGQRTWRNLLKSDPAVDLVHFTILRPPDRNDGVPVEELSLIAFPTRELFIEKIDEFDLIILDRYRRRGILPNSYFANISRYVTDGGALLVVGGPELASAESIQYSPLGRILPAQPTARLYQQAFQPQITDRGARHPVTAGLAQRWADASGALAWGRWLRQVDMDALSGETVMSGADDRPLLVLDRAGEGRIAMLASDQAWLWDRGYEGGGPQAEMLRRLAHWMMGEPELEEEALVAEAQGDALRITRRSMQDGPHQVRITAPDGTQDTVLLTPGEPGRFSTLWAGDEPGLYRLQSGEFDTVAVLGTANPREYTQVITAGQNASDQPLTPLIDATRGGIAAIAQGLPALRSVAPGRQAAGRGWLGITPREALVTTDIRLTPMLPAWAWLLLGAGLMLAGWLREGRRAG